MSVYTSGHAAPVARYPAVVRYAVGRAAVPQRHEIASHRRPRWRIGR